MKKRTKKTPGISGAVMWPYAMLDIIFSFLAGEIRRKDLPRELQGKTCDELHAEYNRRFPILYGNALQDMSRDTDTDDSDYSLIYA